MSTDDKPQPDIDDLSSPSEESHSDAWIGASRLRSVASFGVRAAVLAGLALGATAEATGDTEGDQPVALVADVELHYTTCCPATLL